MKQEQKIEKMENSRVNHSFTVSYKGETDKNGHFDYRSSWKLNDDLSKYVKVTPTQWSKLCQILNIWLTVKPEETVTMEVEKVHRTIFVEIQQETNEYLIHSIFTIGPNGKREQLGYTTKYTKQQEQALQSNEGAEEDQDSTPKGQATTEEIKEFFDRLTGADRLEEDRKKCFDYCFEPVVNQVKSQLSNFLFSPMKDGELAFDILDNFRHYHSTSRTPIDIIIDNYVEDYIKIYCEFADLDSIQSKIVSDLKRNICKHFSGLLNA